MNINKIQGCLNVPILWLTLAIFTVIYSWSMYVWLRYFEVIFIVLPTMVLSLSIVIYMSWFSKVKIHWWSRMSTTMLILLFISTLLLAWSAPMYSRWQARELRQRFISNFNIDISIENEKIQLESGVGDLGLPRYILTSYKFNESIDVVENELSSILTTKRGWQRTEGDLRFFCPFVMGNQDKSPVLLDNLVYIDKDALTILLFVNGSRDCIGK